jgi:hypothetical protein
MSNVAFLPPPEQRIPARSPYMRGRTRLIGMFAADNALLGLVRHLYHVHSIVTVAELDAAGWAVVNTYPGKLSAAKRHKFFSRIGRKAEPYPASAPLGRLLSFPVPR